MIRLQPAQALSLLGRLQPHLSPADSDRARRIAALAAASDQRAQVARVLADVFPGVATDSANKALSRVIRNVNEAATEQGVELRMQVTEARSVGADRRFVWFEGDPAPEVTHTTPELDQVEDRLIEQRRGQPLSTEPRIALTESKGGKPVVRWFLSYARDDERDAQQLRDLLQAHLRTSAKYCFETWHDGLLVAGDHWDKSIRDALQASHLGLLAISPRFLGSDYILRTELPAFVSGADKHAAGKRAVPVMLKLVDLDTTDLKGLGTQQIFRDSEKKAFVERTKHKRDAWAAELARQIHTVLERHADVVSPPAPGSGTLRVTMPAPVLVARGRAGWVAPDSDTMLGPDPDLARQCHLIEPTRARAATLDQRLRDAPPPPVGDDAGVEVMPYLLDWLRDPGAPPLFALLGEYGMGKTITCQRLVRTVEEERRRQPPSGAGVLPQPLYFDLRRLTGLRTSGEVPTVVQIIDECITRGWRLGGEGKPTAQELIDRAADHDLLFIFDGLDEALVHLSEVDGQTFTRELLRLQPPRRRGAAVRHGSGTRILISCRTHYFRSLPAQNSHFTAQERDATPAADYRALVLLPLDEAQVRTYLAHALPDLNTDATLELVRSVHNLSELASRPYTLKLVSEFIPQIEQLRADGRPVYGVTLYRTMVERWMQRDSGKHHLKPEHKERLMTHLAAWMWRRGQRLIEARELEPWFLEWLESQPDLRRRYADIDRDKLEEDLRTATFLVREDGDVANEEAKGPVGSGFRFAHSSMQEFFLSQFLVTALRTDRRDDWALPMPSEETLAFFAQTLQEANDPALLQRLSDWRAPYLALASELWLRYALAASHRGWLAPVLVGADLRGARLQGWRFAGRSTTQPLNLTRADFSGAVLRETAWRHVRLDDARFDGAQLHRAELQDVRAPSASFAAAGCDGTRFRYCEWPGSRWDEATGHRAQFLFTAEPDPWRLGSAGRSLTAPLPAGAVGAGAVSRQGRLAAASGHASAASACAWSPDGSRVVSGGSDGALRLWDARSGECLATWRGHEDGVNACAWSPDGGRVVSGGWDSTLRLWDARSGECLATWTGHEGGVSTCAWSPDGGYVVSGGSDGTLRLWDARSGECLATWRGHEDGVSACAWSPDGGRVVSGGWDRTLRLWDARSGECLATWRGHEDGVNSCAWSPDGGRVVSGGWDGTLRLWDARSDECLATWRGHKAGVNACAWSPDGGRVVSGGWDRTLRLWDARSGECLVTWTGHEVGVNACAWSPDGGRVVSGGWDRTLKLWDARSDECLATWRGHEGGVSACAWSPDSGRVLSGGWDGTLRLWDAYSGECLATWTGHEIGVNACAWSPDGGRVVSGGWDRTLRLWDARSGECLATWRGHEDGVSACVWSPDGGRVVSGGWDGTLRLWGACSGECLAIWAGHERGVSACAWSPDGGRVVSGGSDGTLRLWGARSGECLAIWAGHEHGVSACAWSPDGGRVVSGGSDGTLRLWDARSGECLATWRGHKAGVNACAWSPDGGRVVSGGSDGTLRLWDARSGKCLATWMEHEGGVSACAWSPDSGRVLSGGSDGTLRLWDATDGRLLRIHSTARGAHAVWEPGAARPIEASEGAWRWLVLQCRDEEGHLVDVLPAEALGPLSPPRRLAAAAGTGTN